MRRQSQMIVLILAQALRSICAIPALILIFLTAPNWL